MGAWLKRLSILSLIGFPLAVLGVRLGLFDFRIGISMTGLSLILALGSGRYFYYYRYSLKK